jgi:hypothetical protein
LVQLVHDFRDVVFIRSANKIILTSATCDDDTRRTLLSDDKAMMWRTRVTQQGYHRKLARVVI